MHFQPIFDLKTGQIYEFESLARWTDPELGAVSPSIFIPIAEQIGLIAELTELLLNKAAKIASGWPEPVSISFNISADQLSKPDAGPAILAILNKYRLAPTRFEAEITETAIMRDILNANRTISYLRAAGSRVSLDDFGTGYSSLSQLRALALDKIKIDKSFVDDICRDPRIATLVRSVVEMSKGLNLVSVAEGIEHQDQLDALKLLGCDCGQGYLVCRPVSANEANRLVAERARLAA
jgi:EAL domain-containing protein (putative c-di-GMP-specific phosphodiesterase class I)